MRPAPCILSSLADNRQRSFDSGDFLRFVVYANYGTGVVRPNRLDIEDRRAMEPCNETTDRITVKVKIKVIGSVVKCVLSIHFSRFARGDFLCCKVISKPSVVAPCQAVFKGCVRYTDNNMRCILLPDEHPTIRANLFKLTKTVIDFLTGWPKFQIICLVIQS